MFSTPWPIAFVTASTTFMNGQMLLQGVSTSKLISTFLAQRSCLGIGISPEFFLHKRVQLMKRIFLHKVIAFTPLIFDEDLTMIDYDCNSILIHVQHTPKVSTLANFPPKLFPTGPGSFSTCKSVKYWIEGTFYWPKNCKKGTEYVPRNTSRR